METKWIVWCIVMGIALVFTAWAKWQERKDEDALIERLRTDPEFRAHYHAIHASDDWEDMGYFDGR